VDPRKNSTFLLAKITCSEITCPWLTPLTNRVAMVSVTRESFCRQKEKYVQQPSCSLPTIGGSYSSSASKISSLHGEQESSTKLSPVETGHLPVFLVP
jgi:hypothetical protein